MPSGLNYSKWDNLELSDDSDVEVHPNVDKKSFIRWKQRDIHEKRDIRKLEMQHLKSESQSNILLQARLKQIHSSTESQGSSYFSREASRLSADRASRGSKDGPEGPTQDDMILSLLLQINEEPSVKGKTSTELDQALIEKVKEHEKKLGERQTEVEKEIEKREAEDTKKITSEGIKDGWSSSHIAKAEPAPPAPLPKKKSTSTSKTQQIETLNPSSTSNPTQSPDSDAEDSDEEVPTLTDPMKAFYSLPSTIPSFIPVSSSIKALPSSFNPSKHLDTTPFEIAYKFLASHKELIPESAGTPDALLVEAFQASMRGEIELARRCTEKALMVQYVNKLGKDGMSLFFKRMTGSDGRAAVVYFNDVLATFSRISTRAVEMAAESKSSGAGIEQIQLVAEDPSITISFNVPDGPAPEHIELEGEGAENMDMDLVREFLDRRWKIFNDFTTEMQEALKTQNLDKVNKVLGEMAVEPAEKIVELLDTAGILNFGQKPEEGVGEEVEG